MTLKNLITDLHSHSNKSKKDFFPKFFKAGKGEYAEGDQFIGVTVPNCRSVAKKYWQLDIQEISKLLKSKIHEERLVALMILVIKFEKAKTEDEKKSIYEYYLKNTKYVNNWDLVDLSCYKIVGEFLKDKDKKILYELGESKDLWERRIAIVSTMIFIRGGNLDDTYKISKVLLRDKHDLIHKAVGWLLREAGKKDETRLKKFITDNYSLMPRTTLRYAIERFEEEERMFLLRQAQKPKVKS